MTDHPSALVSVPPHALEAIAFNLCSLHDFDPVFVQQNERFAKAAITEYLRATPAPAAPQAAGVGEREAIARIMDPRGWETRDRQYDAIKRSTMHDKDRPLAFANADYYTRESLTKADAILAIRAPSREPEGRAVRELLREAGKQFRTYEAHHRAKKTNEAYEKAEINARLAERIEAALATREEAPAPRPELAPYTEDLKGIKAFMESEEAPAEAGEIDLYDDKVQAGIAWTMRQWGETLGLKTWTGGDGSESVEGDVGAEIHTILVDAGLRDPETNEMASLRAQPQACEDALPVAKVVSAHGDPEAFGEREIKVLQDLSRTPYDTPLYTHPTPYALRIAIEALAPFARLDVLEPSGVIIGLERYHFERVRQALAALQAEQVAK